MGASFAGVLLVGGKSSRMGEDKALLREGGQSLWERQMGLLSEVAGCVAVSGGIRPGWVPEVAEFLRDPGNSWGPAAGVLAALRWGVKRRCSFVIVLAVDLVGVRAPELRGMLERCSAGCGAIPKTRAGYEPLCAAYPVEALSLVEDFVLGRGGRRLQDLAGELEVAGWMAGHEFPGESVPGWFNLNTPQDVSAWRRARGG